MGNERNKSYGRIGWGISASILLHLLVAAGFFVHLPLPMSDPQKEETVDVELVPPPEPEKPPEKAPEKPPELKLPEPKPPEPKPEEPKKEEPKPEERNKEEPKPPEPPPKPPEAPEPAEPPPPPPPREPEQPKPEEPDPNRAEPEKAEQGKPQPLDVLRPVVEFGEEDSGPRQSLDGDSSVDQPAPVDEALEEDKPDAAPDISETADTAKGLEGSPVPDEITVPDVSSASADPQAKGAQDATVSDEVQAALVLPTPKPQTPAKPKADASAALSEAKRLFSVKDTGGAVARTAIGKIPREIRASQLCSTELREQLRHASPPYYPEMVPAPRLPTGTVMDVRRSAFRAEMQWYDVSFRCEVDDNVTKVVSFAFDIGAPVPRSEWRKRGFPDF
ncbi:DUF930 domain-containing protein [Rhizobium deserti]|uniref:DUF930 domain-containing protein n=2 Tax=Rhizobium deserti TaxID=2547961 RepID=A0A4R5UPA3_9HYPH|nr:DUF930 domain-containing protein [Rhizobium deserti]